MELEALHYLNVLSVAEGTAFLAWLQPSDLAAVSGPHRWVAGLQEGLTEFLPLLGMHGADALLKGFALGCPLWLAHSSRCSPLGSFLFICQISAQLALPQRHLP